MQLIDIAAILTFVILLAMAVGMLWGFYVCDNQTCKAYRDADKAGPPDSKAYALALLQELFNDGIWPVPYVGASIATPLALVATAIPITAFNFAIVWFVFFVVLYFMTNFFGHHYIKPITGDLEDYLTTEYPGEPDDQEDLEEERAGRKISEKLGSLLCFNQSHFVAPVKNF